MNLRHPLRWSEFPDVAALAAKDLLRLAHHGLRKAGAKLPGVDLARRLPGASLARTVTGDAGRTVIGALGSAGRLSRRLFDPGKTGRRLALLPVADLVRDAKGSGTGFADAAYAALTVALRRLGANNALVVELVLREAFYDAAAGRMAAADRVGVEFPAQLAAAMLSRDVIVDVVADEGLTPDLTPADVTSAAIMAFCLSLSVASSQNVTGDLPADLLLACCDLCRALQDELRAAGTNPTALAGFIERYAPHV